MKVPAETERDGAEVPAFAAGAPAPFSDAQDLEDSVANDAQNLLDQLGRGRGAILSSYRLAAAIGVPQRHVGFIVKQLRAAGHCIGSVHGEGYYLITNQDELVETIGHIERRKRGIDETIRNLTESFARVA